MMTGNLTDKDKALAREYIVARCAMLMKDKEPFTHHYSKNFHLSLTYEKIIDRALEKVQAELEKMNYHLIRIQPSSRIFGMLRLRTGRGLST